jgi:predicted Zn-dependent protease
MRLNYGRLLRELGHLSESEKQLRIAAEQTAAADDVRTRASLAETLVASGKLGEAETLLDALHAGEPSHPDVLRGLGRLRVAQGRPQEGLPFLEKGAAGRDPEHWVEIARVRLQLGEAVPALEAARQALSRSPAHPWALAVEGHALLLAGRKAEALATLDRALGAGPRRPEVWLSLALAFDAAGVPDTAARCRREARAVARG